MQLHASVAAATKRNSTGTTDGPTAAASMQKGNGKGKGMSKGSKKGKGKGKDKKGKATAKAMPKAKAKAKAKSKSKGEVATKLVLGCSKCRWARNGCGTCKLPSFMGRRGHP